MSRPFLHLVAITIHLAAVPLPAQVPKTDNKQPPAVNRVRYGGPEAKAQAFPGLKIEGSNVSRHSGHVTLAEISEASLSDGWHDARFTNAKVYRWLRVSIPTSAGGKIGNIELYAGDTLLADDDKGSKFAAFTKGKDAVDEYAMDFDLFYIATARKPSFKPSENDLDKPEHIALSAPRGSSIRYTLDGSIPTAESGDTYAGPIPLTGNSTITAVAFQPGLAPSLPAVSTYLLKDATKPGLRSAHIGNSLTGTTVGFWRYARTAGYEHRWEAFLRGGALTRELWALASGSYTSDAKATAKEATSRKRGSTPWDEFWGKINHVDLLTLQPRDFDLEKELAAQIEFIKLFRQKSPDLQPWLYSEWVEMHRERPSDKGHVPSYQMKKTFPALSWEESMSAMLLYVEELQHRLHQQYKEGKPARVLPSGLAMGWIKNMIDHGRFGDAKPGDFYPLLFFDQVHPSNSPGHGSANGAYLVDMTWFSAFYREAPEGKVLPIETTFSPEQARLVERLAWDVVKNYPDCGLYEEGTQPCGSPEFANDGKVITLKSVTPGAWFRYTLDGTIPTRTRGYVYCGVISVQPGIQVKAIAYKSGMADSLVADGPAISSAD